MTKLANVNYFIKLKLVPVINRIRDQNFGR